MVEVAWELLIALAVERRSTLMLQSLISLPDSDIDLVTNTVHAWYRSHHCNIDSADGHWAVRTAVDLMQPSHTDASLVQSLGQRLAPWVNLQGEV
jgi:hypothetical protein